LGNLAEATHHRRKAQGGHAKVADIQASAIADGKYVAGRIVRGSECDAVDGVPSPFVTVSDAWLLT